MEINQRLNPLKPYCTHNPAYAITSLKMCIINLITNNKKGIGISCTRLRLPDNRFPQASYLTNGRYFKQRPLRKHNSSANTIVSKALLVIIFLEQMSSAFNSWMTLLHFHNRKINSVDRLIAPSP